jgi:hypothetical protein
MIGASHQSMAAVGQRRGVGRLLDLGAEVPSQSCSRTHSIAVFQWATAVSCIVVHQSCISLQTKHAMQHFAQRAEGLLSAALQRLDIAPILLSRLALPWHVPGLSGLKQQKLHDHVPGSLSLHFTSAEQSTDTFCERHVRLYPEAFNSQGRSRLW